MSKTCPYCGRELQAIGGYYHPIFEECICGGEKRAIEASRRKSARVSRQIADERAKCLHEWQQCRQDNVSYYRCPKCGATKMP